ncbi:hypothetical protein [Desertivibrio insolitus]|uniref:hypothetical protein n=1 Tax=Herbiconiux sp. SYSU D00978 TaxID=2812562 RepID=UPI001A9638D1|nr:hypothetical protein [Herbiconiux sp. SYSU D00978]
MNAFLPGTAARSFDETQDLSPWSVEQFLSLSGWVRQELRAGTFAVWSAADESAEILLPYDVKLRDFGRRYREALEILAGITGLEGEALALEIVAARKDIFLLRADQMTVDGSIPFLEARRLIDGVQTMLSSAAASTVNPRASTAGRKPAIVTEFMREDVRMGHTLRGSFVITVLAADAAEEARRRNEWQNAIQHPQPTRSGDDDVRHGEDDELVPFPRQVMSTLASGLSVAKELLGPSGSYVSLEEAVSAGVTLQMLESVRAMSQSEGLHALDMAFRWSKTEPVRPDVPQRIELLRGDAVDAGVVIERFSKAPEIEHDQILGQVVRLERAEGSEDGQVVVEGYVGKAKRRVKVPLSGEAYRVAIAAHEESQPVVVTGTFERKARGWRMEQNASIAEVRSAEPGEQ